ncbi:MAG TPA: nucleotidyl transferase AbiEii/AbiGii toxin family protein [Thermoanaerobaculia bacterium]|nr:nucleotidyl transferase AbiEii/AbiGii toxin family protein [Thermoanaerobaculia bacterium]
MLRPRLDVLPPAQRDLWPDLAALPAGFVLYGGTALALRFAHRVSEDFDFFSNQTFAPDELERQVPFLAAAVRLQTGPNTLVCRIDRGGPVKVSFFGGLSLRRVEDPEPAEGNAVLVASLLDLAATKVKVVQDRGEAKDYLDVDQLLAAGIDLAQALAAARAVYGPTFNPILSAKALSYYCDGDLETLPQEVRSRLTAAAGQVDIARLPEVSARPGGLLP